MDRDSAVTILRGRLKRLGDSSIASTIITELQAAQARLESDPELPWFLLSEDLTATTVVNEERVPVPLNIGGLGRNFLREHEEGALWLLPVDSTEYIEVPKDEYDAISARWPGAGQPQRYALTKDYFRLRPVPDQAYPLKIMCYLSDQVLTSNIENLWLKYASDVLICAAGQMIARYHLRDQAASQIFTEDLAAARQRLFISNEARIHANRNYTMGD